VRTARPSQERALRPIPPPVKDPDACVHHKEEAEEDEVGDRPAAGVDHEAREMADHLHDPHGPCRDGQDQEDAP